VHLVPVCFTKATLAGNIRHGAAKHETAKLLLPGACSYTIDCQADTHVTTIMWCREHSDWTQQEQELLFQISQQFKADSLAPSKDSMHQYMQAMLPGKSISDIASHATW